MVGGRFIPEQTQAVVHTFSLHRDPRYFFPAPDEFIPERWLPDEPLPKYSGSARRHTLDAFIPFSSGPSCCIGKNLAYQQIRMTACWIMKYFDLSLRPKWDKKKWDAGLRDYVVLQKDELPVMVRRRDRIDIAA